MMASSEKSNHFIRTFFLASSVLCTFVIVLNYLLDPYAIFSTPVHPWLNEKKPQAENQLRLIKAIAIMKRQPKVLLAGSSGVHVGMGALDGKEFGLSEVCNMGLPGATVEELLGYFEHALFNQAEVETLILGLDFFMFNRHRKLNIEYDPKRMKRYLMPLEDYLATLFSMHALKNSVLTLAANHPLGNLLARKEKEAAKSVPGILNEEERNFLRDIMIAREWYGKFEIDPFQLSCYAKIVSLCQEKKIDLKIFFAPAQAVYWEAINLKGLWPQLEELKVHLSRLHPLLDFSGYNSIASRSFETEELPLFSDCSHYTPIVGRLILSKIYGIPIPYADFGRKLTPETVQCNLEAMRKEQEEWRQLHPQLAEAVRNLHNDHAL